MKKKTACRDCGHLYRDKEKWRRLTYCLKWSEYVSEDSSCWAIGENGEDISAIEVTTTCAEEGLKEENSFLANRSPSG